MIRGINSLHYEISRPFSLGDSVFNDGPSKSVSKLTKGLSFDDYVWFSRDIKAYDGSVPRELLSFALFFLFSLIDRSHLPQWLKLSQFSKFVDCLVSGLVNATVRFPWGETLDIQGQRRGRLGATDPGRGALAVLPRPVPQRQGHTRDGGPVLGEGLQNSQALRGRMDARRSRSNERRRERRLQRRQASLPPAYCQQRLCA